MIFAESVRRDRVARFGLPVRRLAMAPAIFLGPAAVLADGCINLRIFFQRRKERRFL